MRLYILINTNPLYKGYFRYVWMEFIEMGLVVIINVVTVLSLFEVYTFSKGSCFVTIRVTRRGSLRETRQGWNFGLTPLVQSFSLVTAMTMKCAKIGNSNIAFLRLPTINCFYLFLCSPLKKMGHIVLLVCMSVGLRPSIVRSRSFLCLKLFR